MDSSDAIQLISIFILLLLSAFFTSAEAAVTTISKAWAPSPNEKDNKKATILAKLTKTPDRLLCTILIGSTLANITIVILTTLFTIKHFGEGLLIAAAAIIGLLILIFGRVLPRTLATMNAEKTALAYAPTLQFLMMILTPFVFVILKFGSAVLKVFGLNPLKRTPAMTEDDLRTIVDASHEEGVIEQEEKQIIHNVFDFSDTQAKDVMIPRIDMTFLDVNTTYEELIAIHDKNTYTRYPVYEDNTDSVIGTINIKDLLFYDKKGEFSLRNFLRDPYFTYEHKNSSALFFEMRDQSINFAIVLDEYGATAGLITLEDMLEEIVGDIRDEYDDEEEEQLITPIIEGREYIVLGSARLDDINEELGLALSSDEYDSIGGFMIDRLDRIPEAGEEITAEDGTHLVIDKLSNNRIELVHVFIPHTDADTNDDTNTSADIVSE